MKPVSIISALRPLRNRIYLQRILTCLILAVLTAGIMGFLLTCWGLAFPVAFILKKVVATYTTLLGLCTVITLFLLPGRLETIKKADTLGLKERAVTALELWEDRSQIAALQRKDTLDTIAGTDFKMLYKMKVPVKLLYTALILAALTTVSLYIPTKAKYEAKHVESLIKIAQKQSETIEKVRKEIRKKEFTATELSEIDKMLQQLQREMKAANTEEKVLKALSRAKNEMDTQNSLNPGTSMEKLTESLFRHELTRSIADALKNQNPEEFKKLLEKANNEISNLDANGRKQLAGQIRKAAEEIGDNSELAKSLNDLARSVAAGKLQSASGALQQLNNTLAQMSRQDAQLSEALARYQQNLQGQLSRSLQDAQQRIASYEGNEQMFGDPQNGEMSQSGDEGQQANGNSEAQKGQGQNGKGSSQGSGQGNSGQGDGQGQQGSNGAGNNSSNGSLGYSDEQSGGQGRMPGEKTVKEYESIYVPDRLGEDKGTQASYVKGNKGAQGQSSWSQAEGAPIEKGAVIPYNKVLGNYKNEAMSSLKNNPIPPGMEEIVRDYFTSLE